MPCSPISRCTTGDSRRWSADASSPRPSVSLTGAIRADAAACSAGAAVLVRSATTADDGASLVGCGAGVLRRCRHLGRRGRLQRSCRCRLGSRDGPGIADAGQHRADVDGVTLLHQDLAQQPGRRRRHLGVDLVGRDLEEELVLGDLVAHLLEPAGDGPVGDGLTELGHRDLCHREWRSFLVLSRAGRGR